MKKIGLLSVYKFFVNINLLTGSTNFEATNPALARIRLLFNKVFYNTYKLALNGQKIQENSGFIVSELVVGAGDQDNNSHKFRVVFTKRISVLQSRTR